MTRRLRRGVELVDGSADGYADLNRLAAVIRDGDVESVEGLGSVFVSKGIILYSSCFGVILPKPDNSRRTEWSWRRLSSEVSSEGEF